MRSGRAQDGSAKELQRVMIIGQPGSGKSTLARMLGSKTGLPVVHIDLIHWMSGWVERAKPEKIRLALIEQDKDAWIIEGGLGATKEHRLNRCDMLINLDFPLWFRAWRVFKRTVLNYGKTRPDLPEGCPEQFSYEFWKWIWDTSATNRVTNLRWMAKAGPHVTVHHLTSRHAVRQFLDGL